MPTNKYFDRCPEFPADVPVVDIPVVKFERLQRNDEAESRRLFEASQEFGFFLLDLSGSDEGETVIGDAEFLFDLGRDVFMLDTEEKERYKWNPPKDLLGYKSAGKLKTENGKFDFTETYSLGQDDVLGTTDERRNPEPIESNRSRCQEFFRHAHKALCTVLDQLDTQLGLPRTTLSKLCPLGKTSDTSVRMLYSPPSPTIDNGRITLPGHTDIGIITMLFNITGGLQILPAGEENLPENWRYVRPRPGCAIVNLGDTLVEWTGGVLRSSLHRVVSPPGEQAKVTRQSFAYLIRPDHDGSMRRLKSEIIPTPREGDEETRDVNEWASWRAKQIVNGELKPRTIGGKPVRTTPTAIAV